MNQKIKIEDQYDGENWYGTLIGISTLEYNGVLYPAIVVSIDNLLRAFPIEHDNYKITIEDN